MKYDIIGLGATLVDKIAKVPKIIGPEEKVNVQSITLGFGGPTTNNLVQAARLGLNVSWIGQIGDDSTGNYILRSFRDEGMDIDHIIVVPGETSAETFIAVDDNGQRAIYISSNITGKISAETVKNHYGSIIPQARMFNSELCQIPLEAVLEGAKIAKKNGVKVAVDYDIDARIYIEQNQLGTWEQLEELISITDVFKIGITLAESVLGTGIIEEIISRVHMKGPSMVAITCGENGSVICKDNEIVNIPCIPVVPKDSTGAGDAYMGGLCYGILQDWPLEKIGRFANACGSYCCQEIGAQHLADLNKLIKFMEANGVVTD